MKNTIKFFVILLFPLMLSCEVNHYPYYLQIPGEIAFSVIIDGSGSMSSIITEVRTALSSLVSTLEDEDEMQFIQSGDPPIVLNTWSTVEDELRNSITLLSPAGDDERYELAIEEAASSAPSGKLNCILLFGDGEIYYGVEPDENEVTSSIIATVRGYNAVVFTFGIGSYNEAVLRSLSDAGNGAFYVVTDPGSFGDIYNDLKETLRNNYY